jgi:DNA-binding Lrp family transcriptional regulator
MKLDRIDYAILDALQKDGRLSNKVLAARVGLAASSCFERVRKLTDAGVIEGYTARVAEDVFGIELQAMISIRLSQHSRELVDSFRQHLQDLPEVLATYHLAGRQDFMVHVAVRDTEHLRDLAMDVFTTRPEVAHIETSLIYAFERRHDLPNYAEPE